MHKGARLAKCGIHSVSFCNNKHDSPQCDECILVRHRKEPLYKFINGYKLKRCPKCGEYKLLNEFYLTNGRYFSWCKKCSNEYGKEHNRANRKHYMIGHKVSGRKVFVKVDSSAKMLKFIREHMVIGNETFIEIKRIK